MCQRRASPERPRKEPNGDYDEDGTEHITDAMREEWSRGQGAEYEPNDEGCEIDQRRSGNYTGRIFRIHGRPCIRFRELQRLGQDKRLLLLDPSITKR